ncbi:MAG: hypothetical protein AAFN78_16840 [Pseudomonadota bacterium]
MSAQHCFNRWVAMPTQLLKNPDLAEHAAYRDTVKLMAQGKLTDTIRKSPKEDPQAIQKILRYTTLWEQLERDVAMWYGYCNGNGKGAQFMLKIFTMLRRGVLYRRGDGTWGDFSVGFPNAPVASLLSHGGRILILLPASNSSSRVYAHKAGKFLKGATYDILTSWTDSQHKSMGKTKNWKSVGSRILSPIGSALSLGHKTYAAGDDRIWNHIGGRTAVHSRMFATHSTVVNRDPERLPGNRFLWFTEEKAKGGTHHLSNVRDSMMGRHYFKDVALGGVGNYNPFSGVKIKKDGAHGHVYMNYRAPQYHDFGCLLIGCEGSNAGRKNQYGKVHDANATKGEFSATGGVKWGMPNSLGHCLGTNLYEASGKNDVTTFVCDLSEMSNSELKAYIDVNLMGPADLHRPPNRVYPADWTKFDRRRAA